MDNQSQRIEHHQNKQFSSNHSQEYSRNSYNSPQQFQKDSKVKNDPESNAKSQFLNKEGEITEFKPNRQIKKNFNKPTASQKSTNDSYNDTINFQQQDEVKHPYKKHMKKQKQGLPQFSQDSFQMNTNEWRRCSEGNVMNSSQSSNFENFVPQQFSYDNSAQFQKVIKQNTFSSFSKDYVYGKATNSSENSQFGNKQTIIINRSFKQNEDERSIVDDLEYLIMSSPNSLTKFQLLDDNGDIQPMMIQKEVNNLIEHIQLIQTQGKIKELPTVTIASLCEKVIDMLKIFDQEMKKRVDGTDLQDEEKKSLDLLVRHPQDEVLREKSI